jgi:hypothetical protein
LKDSIARTDPMTPVSKPRCVRQSGTLHTFSLGLV